MKAISESGAKVIVSGGNVGELAMHFVERYKLMLVKVQSKFQLRRICKATGATPLVRVVCVSTPFRLTSSSSLY